MAHAWLNDLPDNNICNNNCGHASLSFSRQLCRNFTRTLQGTAAVRRAAHPNWLGCFRGDHTHPPTVAGQRTSRTWTKRAAVPLRSRRWPQRWTRPRRLFQTRMPSPPRSRPRPRAPTRGRRNKSLPRRPPRCRRCPAFAAAA